MTLTTHAVIGAATAQLVSVNPAVGFFAGFLSHFVLDAIPHGHYSLRSHTRHPENRLQEDMVMGKGFLFDLMKIGFDFCLGIVLTIIVFQPFGSPRFLNIFLGMLGGVLPDALQFMYFKIRREPLTSLQRFHTWIHAKMNFNKQMPKAILVESVTIAIAAFWIKMLLPF